MSGLGIFARNFVMSGWNDVISNCGLYTAALTIGGSYEFTHCTFGNYWNFGQRSTPAVYLNNYTVNTSNTTVPVDLVKADFKNCIIYGNNDNELELDFKSGATSTFNFSYCILKTDENTPTNGSGFDNIWGSNPQFKDTYKNDLTLDTLAFATQKGNPLYIQTGVTPPMTIDIRGNQRPNGSTANPDLGAYERD